MKSAARQAAFSSRALSQSQALEFQLLRPGAAANPFPIYRALQAANGPIFKSPYGYWLVLDYDFALEILRDERAVAITKLSLRPDVEPGTYPILDSIYSDWVLSASGDRWRDLRHMLAAALSEPLRQLIEVDVIPYVDRALEGLDWSQPVDIVEQLAQPVPWALISKLLGIPTSDRFTLRQHTADLSEILEPFFGPSRLARAERAAAHLIAYCESQPMVWRRLLPGRMSDRSADGIALANAILLMASGQETTTNLISMSVRELVQTPDALRSLLVREADSRLAVEELIRYTSPIQIVARVAAEPIPVGGSVVQPGEVVIINLASANRDPRVFADADSLVLDRDPNPHLGFGESWHRCFGSSLARAEMHHIIEVGMEPLVGKVVREASWSSKRTVRGLEKLILV